MLDKRTASIFFTILVFAGAIVLIYAARRPLLILIFAVLFAYLLEPLVVWFEKRLRSSRTVGIAATYFLLTAALSIFFAAAGPKIVQETLGMAHEIPSLDDNISSGDIAERIGSRGGWTYLTRYRLQEFLSAHRTEISGFVQKTVNRIPSMFGDLLWILLIPILAVFILKSKAEFVATVLQLANNRHDRQFLLGIFSDLDWMLAAFIRAQMSLAGVSIVVYTVVLLLARFPYSFLVAAIAGVLEFIPVVGPLAGNISILGMGIVTGYRHVLAILIFLIIWRVLQDYVTSPMLMGRGVRLHPFTVILGVLICGGIAGLPGIFLSVPLMASIRIVWKNWAKRGMAIHEAKTKATEAESLLV